MSRNPWRGVSREFFPFRMQLSTRWADNDAYGHANNATYISWMDTIVNNFLISQRLLSLPGASPSAAAAVHDSCRNCIGICAENGFNYFSSVSYPQQLELGLCATHIGRIAVTYRVGVFLAHPQLELGEDESIRAIGKFVHVFTDKTTHKPLAHMPPELHKALSTLLVEEPKHH